MISIPQGAKSVPTSSSETLKKISGRLSKEAMQDLGYIDRLGIGESHRDFFVTLPFDDFPLNQECAWITD